MYHTHACDKKLWNKHLNINITRPTKHVQRPTFITYMQVTQTHTPIHIYC